MDKIKKWFKEFWLFVRLQNIGANCVTYRNKSWRWGFLVAILSVEICLIQIEGNFAAFALMPMLFVYSIGVIMNAKPSLYAVTPFTSKQRVAYSYLYAILESLAFFLVLAIFGNIAFAISALVTYIVEGTNMYLFYAQDSFSALANATVLLMMIYLFFAMFVLIGLKKGKLRLAAFVLFPIINEALALTLINFCAKAKDASTVGFSFTADVLSALDILPHGWVVLLVLGVMVVITFGLSLYLMIKRNSYGKV